MLKKIIIYIVLCLSVYSCSNNEGDDEISTGFPVLSYSAEISETLNLDISNIIIDQPKK